MQTQAMMTDTHEQQVVRRTTGPLPGSTCSAGAPFALVSIGSRSYEIAEISGEAGLRSAGRTQAVSWSHPSPIASCPP